MKQARKAVQTPEAPRPLGRYSQAVRAGPFLFIQGMIALDPATGRLVDGGIGAQTRLVFGHVEAVLRAAGMVLEDVVRVTVFLHDLDDAATFNEEYQAVFDGPVPPARTMVQARLPLGALVEVEVTAAE